jgi:hypothetical protein
VRTVTVDPETVHTDVVVDAKETALPLDDVAETANGADEMDFEEGTGNVMVCAATPTTSTGEAEEVVCAFARVPLVPLPQHDAEPSLPMAHV